MCGLLGHSFTKTFRTNITIGQYASMMTMLALNMDRRGGDSWGTAQWTGSWQEPAIEHGMGIMARDIGSRIKLIPPIRVDHTRRATTGGKTLENAHPFRIGSIVGAHNGIVSNHKKLEEARGLKWEVDSQAIFHYLAEGWDLTEIEAYGAVTYTRDRDPGRIYLSRFNNGQLSVAGIGEREAPDAVIWASTKDALKEALVVSGLDGRAFEYSIEDGKEYYVVGGRLFVVEQDWPIKKSYSSNHAQYYGGNYREDSARSTGSRGGYQPGRHSSTPSKNRKHQSGRPGRQTQQLQLVGGTNSPAQDLSIAATSRIPINDPPLGTIRHYGYVGPDCDWCNIKWKNYVKDVKAYFCDGCYHLYMGDLVDEGNSLVLQQSRNVLTRAEIMGTDAEQLTS